ncbi:hypothetical protein ACGFYQ_30330 [Streptomyces sp. NPDC048258]|uniref:hypothetical protein n=1 Tax=Streptomyces sp. NPDC048258 TaxID=3365527 RepID=UPI003712B032
MADEPDTTPIQNLYAQRFAADLETNRKEQEDVSSQIAELEVRLKQLKEDESWLCGVQGALPPVVADATAAQSPAEDTAAVPPASAEAAVAGTVPKPRRARKATDGAARGRKATQAEKPSDDASAHVKAKSTARKPATAATRKTTEHKASKASEPPLRELVLALLVSAREPRMVSEVATELAQAHPARPASTQVVRNTLEALAKKGSVEKQHKQGSVMYTAPQPATAEPAVEAVPTPETTEEKVPADI